MALDCFRSFPQPGRVEDRSAWTEGAELCPGRGPGLTGVSPRCAGSSGTILSTLYWGRRGVGVPMGAWLRVRGGAWRRRVSWWAESATDVCPAPTRRRIVDRMDRAGDGDGWVSLAELRAWIAHTQQRHIRDSVTAAWNTYDTDRDGRVGWEELRNATYGHYAPGMRRDPDSCSPRKHTHCDLDLFDSLILRTFSLRNRIPYLCF